MTLSNYRTFRFFFVLVFPIVLILFIPPESAAQAGLNASDLSRVQSQDVSDAQLRSFINRAQQEGVSIDEAFQMARQRGLPSSVASQLRTRVEQLRLEEDRDRDTAVRDRDPDADLRRDFFRPERQETEQMRRTFGSQIFRQQHTEFTPTQNIPTPVSYTLGAGDELSVHIWGDQTNTYRLVVNAEGSVMIDNLGPVFVQGLTVSEANERIIENLRQNYSGLRPESGDQTTYARVTIDRLRTIQVAIIGEAVNPGDYAIPSNSTVFNALYRAGGPGENGSYRKIRVIREDEVVAELDLYNFLVDGLQHGNVQLRDRDVIQILPYQNRVEVFGETKRNDLFFEVKEGETLSDLIRFAGYFTDQAYTRQFRLHRNTPTERRIVTVRSDEIDEFPVYSGDVLHVDEILERFENRVSISGAVWRSGEFEMREGMTLHDLISEADGIRPDAFRSRGIINRMQDDFTFEQIAFDVSAVLQNPDQFDIPLHREDHVRIRSIHDMADDRTVRVDGAVRNSGSFTYREHMTLEDLILQADGFSDAASEARIEISRRITGEAAPEQRGDLLADIYTFEVSRDLQLREEDRMFLLQPFDRVYVHRRPDYQTQRTIRIEGEVMYPGTYTLSNRNERISDIIERAGGLTAEAYMPGARLVRQHTAIDRPEIDLDFLSEDELINEERLGFVSDREREAERRREQERRTAYESDEYNNNDEEDERSVERRRAELNRMGIRTLEEDEEEPLTDEERRLQERRIGIDLGTILAGPGTQEDLYLRDGDVLRIPQELQTVAISGAVMQDVEVRYRDGASLSYYIDRAGGFAENARKGRVYVVYANGDVDRRKRYLFGLVRTSPDIEPGTQIIIPGKPPRDRMNVGELVSVSAAIVGMTTSLIIAIDRLSR
jgi:protein involved in polysaccharide export with SLBB domain